MSFSQHTAGLTDEELDSYEKDLDLILPVDLRCLLTFHGGQEANFHTSKGTAPTWFVLLSFSIFLSICLYLCFTYLSSHPPTFILHRFFGKLKSYDYLNNFSFSALHFAKMHKKLYAVLSGKNGGHCLLCYLGDVSNNKNKNKRNINNNLKIGNVIATNGSSYFLEAKSVLDLFCRFASQLEEHRMPVHEGVLYRFWGDPSVTCITRGVHIRVYTSYLYELSSLHCHVFAYLVEFKMDATAKEENACKLETRMWEVESSKGGTNRVEGDGVIGEYPVFKRGTHYTYISCTNIFDSAASMRGYYTVKNLSTNQRYRLKIPEFHMEIPQLFDLWVCVYM